MKKRKKWLRSEAAWAWGMMLPGLLVLTVFVFWPLIYSLPLAFTDYSVVGEMKFVGTKNFERAFSDPDFIASLTNSIQYVLVVPVIQMASMAFAVALNQKIRGVKVFRTLYYFPVVTSTVAVSIVWSWLFSSGGLVNQLLLDAHIISEKVNWLSDDSTALWVLMFITTWKGVGYYMVIYLAGLQSIPGELIEAARIDRAGTLQIFFKILVPLLKPQVVMCSLLSVMSAIKVFDEPFVLTKGGPGNSTLTASLYIYQNGFQNFDFGYAAALSLILSVIILFFSLLVNAYNRRK